MWNISKKEILIKGFVFILLLSLVLSGLKVFLFHNTSKWQYTESVNSQTNQSYTVAQKTSNNTVSIDGKESMLGMTINQNYLILDILNNQFECSKLCNVHYHFNHEPLTYDVVTLNNGELYIPIDHDFYQTIEKKKEFIIDVPVGNGYQEYTFDVSNYNKH